MGIILRQLGQFEVDTIQPRILDELNARYFYEAAMAWCKNNGYDKAAEYFRKEAEQENEHYLRWVKFLSDWNVAISFPTISPPIILSSLKDILEQAYSIELALFDSYSYNAKSSYDNPNLLIMLWDYVKIQNDSVIEYNDLLTKAYNYQSIDPNLVLFEQENF